MTTITITIERSVLEQALDLIEGEYQSLPEDKAYKVLTDLRIALTAPATALEPIAYTTGTYGGRFTLEPMNPAITIPKGFALYLHPPATAPEQPAWHDAPTCAGLWAPPCGAVLNVTQTDLEYWKQVKTQPRWFGPIREDKP